jgi:hypothetical protein
MTVTLERPMSRACDSILASDIRHLIDNFDEKIYNIIRDYQEEFGCEVILIDDNQNHCQIKIYDTGKIELLRQRYLQSGGLADVSFFSFATLSQFTALINFVESPDK